MADSNFDGFSAEAGVSAAIIETGVRPTAISSVPVRERQSVTFPISCER
jgi:hypothetical protein